MGYPFANVSDTVCFWVYPLPGTFVRHHCKMLKWVYLNLRLTLTDFMIRKRRTTNFLINALVNWNIRTKLLGIVLFFDDALVCLSPFVHRPALYETKTDRF